MKSDEAKQAGAMVFYPVARAHSWLVPPSPLLPGQSQGVSTFACHPQSVLVLEHTGAGEGEG